MATIQDTRRALAHAFNGLVQHMSERCIEKHRVPLSAMFHPNVWRIYGPLVTSDSEQGQMFRSRFGGQIYHALLAFPSPRLVRENGYYFVQFYDKDNEHEVEFTKCRRFGNRHTMHANFRKQLDVMIRENSPEGFDLLDEMIDNKLPVVDYRDRWEREYEERQEAKFDDPQLSWDM